MIARLKPWLRREGLAGALVALGFLQLSGYLIGAPPLQGLGRLSAASPLPFVFSAFRGVETFAWRFAVELEGAGEAGPYRLRHDITPAVYGRLPGPYNRRNTFGAVMSYGPGLDRPEERALVASVLRYGLCGEALLARELALPLPGPVRRFTVEARSRTHGDDTLWRETLTCP